MAIRIEGKIVDYTVGSSEGPQAEQAPVAVETEAPKPQDNVVQLHEKLERPEMLIGSTYKVKTPLTEHALYVTINDIILNHGTENELRRPFEIFINSKNMDHFQWIVALTRIISAVFRKGGDVTFLVEELRSVFDPRGGYFKKGGRYMPSLVAEIGDAIECHMRMIGLLKDEGLDEERKRCSRKSVPSSKPPRPRWEKRERVRVRVIFPTGHLCVSNARPRRRSRWTAA